MRSNIRESRVDAERNIPRNHHRKAIVMEKTYALSVRKHGSKKKKPCTSPKTTSANDGTATEPVFSYKFQPSYQLDVGEGQLRAEAVGSTLLASPEKNETQSK